jgi:hypothetical protein
MALLNTMSSLHPFFIYCLLQVAVVRVFIHGHNLAGKRTHACMGSRSPRIGEGLTDSSHLL